MGLPPFTDSPHDRELLERLRPPDWPEPDPPERYHLVVLGAGSAGLVTAAIAAGLGARVALIERSLMGGDCLNFGCVPSKALLAAAREHRRASRTETPNQEPDRDALNAALERMRRVRAEISVVDAPTRFRDLGVDVWLGQGAFAGRDTITVADRSLRFHRAVIATGSRPSLPPVPGLLETGHLTSESVFSIRAIPRRLALLGAGAIGCELAQVFARFGVRVTMIELAERILPREDPEAAAIVAESLRQQGVELVTGVRCESVAADGKARRVRLEGREKVDLIVDEILVATGRTPNLEGLRLDQAGIEHDPNRGLRVDDRLRTSNPRVYAAGDVTGGMNFTHLADAHARLVARNALFFGRGRASELIIPWCTYTSPEVAHVGAPFPELASRAAELDTITIPNSEVDRARLDGDTRGFLRVHLKKGSDTIVGATLVGEGAGEIISQLALLMKTGEGLGRLSEVIYPYPTRAEILRKAADAWSRGRLTPLVRKGFDLYFRRLGS